MIISQIDDKQKLDDASDKLEDNKDKYQKINQIQALLFTKDGTASRFPLIGLPLLKRKSPVIRGWYLMRLKNVLNYRILSFWI